ncbi:MAG: hypothetical protein QM765_35685 [Myxococcales bacterium]
MLLLTVALVLTACPFEVVRDSSAEPKTLLTANGAVFAKIAGGLKAECDAERARLFLEEPGRWPAPITFRLQRSPLQLTLEIPEPSVPPALGVAQRLEQWQWWESWMQRVLELYASAAKAKSSVLVLPMGVAGLEEDPRAHRCTRP